MGEKTSTSVFLRVRAKEGVNLMLIPVVNETAALGGVTQAAAGRWIGN